jgi:hypothetical protein
MNLEIKLPSCIYKEYESITENGFIRALFLTGSVAELERRADALRQNTIDSRLWLLSGRKDKQGWGLISCLHPII